MAAKKKTAAKKKDEAKGSGLPPRKPRTRKEEVPLPPMGDEPEAGAGPNPTEEVNAAVGRGMRAIADAVDGGEKVVMGQVSEAAAAHSAADEGAMKSAMQTIGDAVQSVEGTIADQVSEVSAAHDAADSAIQEALSTGAGAPRRSAAAESPDDDGGE